MLYDMHVLDNVINTKPRERKYHNMVEVVSNANSLIWNAMSDMASMVGDGLIALASILESLGIVNLSTDDQAH